MKRLLGTSATGLVGSHLLAALLRRNEAWYMALYASMFSINAGYLSQ